MVILAAIWFLVILALAVHAIKWILDTITDIYFGTLYFWSMRRKNKK